jgi:hypothetical protein
MGAARRKSTQFLAGLLIGESKSIINNPQFQQSILQLLGVCKTLRSGLQGAFVHDDFTLDWAYRADRSNGNTLSGFGAKDIQRWRDNAGGAVADRARGRIVWIKPAVPPKHVQHSTIGRNVWEELVPNGLIINQRGSGVGSSRAVVPCKEDPSLAALAGHRRSKERCS